MRTAVPTVRRSLARILEAPSTPLVDRPSRWESMIARVDVMSPLRALSLPKAAAVIGVGGATLGGSGRTPVSIALASALAARGHRVALIGHGHGARSLSRVHVVDARSKVGEVGDEALLAARGLDGRARVVVAPTRAEALDHAARTHDVLIVDRLLQTTPVRLARALLVVDDDAPWGSGRLVPFGDLSAPRAALLDAADEVVRVGSRDARSVTTLPRSVAGTRVGLVTSIARPGRVVAALASLGVHPIVHVERPDHGRARRGESHALVARARAEHIDVWLLDAKSAIHLDLGSSGATLDHRVVLGDDVVDRVSASASTFLDCQV